MYYREQNKILNLEAAQQIFVSFSPKVHDQFLQQHDQLRLPGIETFSTNSALLDFQNSQVKKFFMSFSSRPFDKLFFFFLLLKLTLKKGCWVQSRLTFWWRRGGLRILAALAVATNDYY